MFTGTTMRTSTIARTALLVALALVTTGLAQAASPRRDGDNSRRRGEFSIVQLRPASGMPSGAGDTTTTSGALRNNDGNGRGPHKGEFSIVQLRPASGIPSGAGDTTTTSDALRSSAAGFRQSLNLSAPAAGAARSFEGINQARTPASSYSYLAPSSGSTRALGRSRAWMSVSLDGENGLEASGGLTWDLR